MYFTNYEKKFDSLRSFLILKADDANLEKSTKMFLY